MNAPLRFLLSRAWLTSIALVLATGCATARTEFMPDTHAPISVYDRIETRTGVEKVQTGSATYTNGNGEVTGGATFYRNQVVHWKERNWYPIQGQERLDDESFYRIVGDQEAVDLYSNYHKKGVSKHKLGLGLLAGGVALIGGGIAMTYVGANDRNSGLQYGGYITGLVGLTGGTVGLVLTLVGKRQAETTDHRLIEDPRRVKADAMRYNTALAASLPPPPAPPPPPVAPPPEPTLAQGGSLLGGRAPIRVVPVFGTLIGQPVRRFELAGDGSVIADGRKVATIIGSEVRDTRGEMIFWLRSDGAIVERGGKVDARFQGDDLVQRGTRLLVGPGGRILSVLAGGSQVAGQVIRGAHFKRTVMVALYAALVGS
jgi:hypothetical protein